jgi:hypothetical protein
VKKLSESAALPSGCSLLAVGYDLSRIKPNPLLVFLFFEGCRIICKFMGVLWFHFHMQL